MAKSVYDGQFDVQAIEHRTRAILAKKRLRLEKLTGAHAKSKERHGYGPYIITGGTYGDAYIKVVAEGLFIEELEAKAEELPAWGDRYTAPLTPTEIIRASAGGDAGVRKMAASMLPTAAPTPIPQPTPEPPAQASDQGQRIAELEAENLLLKQQVRERDQMIAFLKQRGA